MRRKVILTDSFNIGMVTGDQKISFKEVDKKYVLNCVNQAAHLRCMESMSAFNNPEIVDSFLLDIEATVNPTDVILDAETTLYVVQQVKDVSQGSTELKFYEVEPILQWECEAADENGGDYTCVQMVGTYHEAEDYAESIMPPYEGVETYSRVTYAGPIKSFED